MGSVSDQGHPGTDIALRLQVLQCEYRGWADLEELTAVDVEGWLAEIPMIREYYQQFGSRMPAALLEELDALEARLRAAQS